MYSLLDPAISHEPEANRNLGLAMFIPEEQCESPIVRFGMYFFGTLVLLVAPIAAYSTAVDFLDARVSRNWPHVQGKVIESRVQRNQQLSTRTFFKPIVVYRYEVGGKPYTADRISHQDFGDADESAAHSICAPYPTGASVEVFYNPENPAAGLLEPGLTWRSYFSLLIAPLTLALGLGSIFSARFFGKRRRERLAKGDI
jgi:hypothetical protein